MVDLVLRPVSQNDMQTIFDWRNDPWIVSLSLSGKAISWDDHVNWFGNMLQDDQIKMFVIEHSGLGCGQLRFDRQGEDETDVTVYLLKRHTGQGIGTAAIRQGCATIFDEWTGLRCVRAHIVQGNEESRKAFEKAGFEPDGKHERHFDMVLRYDTKNT